ncbi:hypothetical protein FH609_001670 [Streptomyces sp. 3MP-14]|uniref:hypothetical protein n=1 Tax=Streptomyces sp. 3MP-14 TaxID=2586636 RepID=UPI001118B9C7|nr:hypothetical protein [Streptomyces sp. 3MP-14]KAB8179730.1 hypothetical protein FH609_001670 [Streptomyces sp. 3MP-14]
MKRSQRRALAALTVGAVSLPALLLATAPAAQAAGVPIEPVGPIGELPYCEDTVDSEDVAVWLQDVPEDHASPTAWTEFLYTVENGGDEPVDTIYTKLEGWYNAADGSDEPFPFQIQWFVDGEWRDVPFESDAADGHFGVIDQLAPGDSADVQIRTRAEQDRPGWFESWASIRYYDAEDETLCVRDSVEAEWALVPEGDEAPGEPDPEEPGQPSEEPQPGEPSEEPNAPAPQGGSDDDAELAETGGSHALPIAAGIGGAALVAGAGALLIAHRNLA